MDRRIFTVRFVREGREAQVEEGTTLLAAEIAAGLVPDAPCGGQGKCGKCKVKLDGEIVSACRTVITGDCAVETLHDEEKSAKILKNGNIRRVPCEPGRLPGGAARPLLAAVDLGSTSVVAYLLDAATGETLGTESILNPQRQFGADVVMRSGYVLEHGAESLSTCIRQAIDELLGRLAAGVGQESGDIVRIVMVGNTCMHHLFLELPVDNLVHAPYTPSVTDAVTRKALECDIHVHPEANLSWLPNIGGFVGADTAACMLAAEFDKREELTLLVDIGTNGEMVLGNRDGYTVCSTAAGPAFEGAKISCGMRGSRGAIDHVKIEDGKLKFHVIGECAPAGLCGSGLLDAAACLLELGLIDETGYMKEPYFFSENVSLTQKDIRELQLAKAAIAAGIRLLCRRRGVKPEEIRTLLLAGAFGNYLAPESACAIGLLPLVLKERIIPVGNAAGAGARLAVLSEAEFARSREMAARADFLELACEADFMDVYVDEMSFAKEDFYGI